MVKFGQLAYAKYSLKWDVSAKNGTERSVGQVPDFVLSFESHACGPCVFKQAFWQQLSRIVLIDFQAYSIGL